jgi:hypothetical protein
VIEHTKKETNQTFQKKKRSEFSSYLFDSVSKLCSKDFKEMVEESTSFSEPIFQSQVWNHVRIHLRNDEMIHIKQLSKSLAQAKKKNSEKQRKPNQFFFLLLLLVFTFIGRSLPALPSVQNTGAGWNGAMFPSLSFAISSTGSNKNLRAQEASAALQISCKQRRKENLCLSSQKNNLIFHITTSGAVK